MVWITSLVVIIFALVLKFKPELVCDCAGVADEPPRFLPKDVPIEVHYFDIRGRAEPIRLFLEVHGVEYKDVRFSGDQWREAKQKNGYEFAQVPALKIGNQINVQSDAILRYLGRLYGKLPKKHEKRLDEVHGAIDDLRRAYSAVAYGRGAESIDDFVTITGPKWLAALDRVLYNNGGLVGWGLSFVGEGYTYVDYFAYYVIEAVSALLLSKDDSAMDDYPNIRGFMSHFVSTQPRLAEYLRSSRRPKYFNGAAAVVR